MKRKHYTAPFKAQLVQEMLREEKTIAQIASEYGVHPTQLNQWKTTAVKGLASLFERKDTTGALKAEYEAKLTEAYAEVGNVFVILNKEKPRQASAARDWILSALPGPVDAPEGSAG